MSALLTLAGDEEQWSIAPPFAAASREEEKRPDSFRIPCKAEVPPWYRLGTNVSSNVSRSSRNLDA
jgi:hypothetical protein